MNKRELNRKSARTKLSTPKRQQVESKTRSEYHHGNLRQALIECGLKLLDDVGLQDMSLRSAARMAGVSQTAPRNHFQDKAGLLAAIAAHGFDLLTQKRIVMLRKVETPEQRLRTMIRSYVEFAVERPALFDLMFGSTIPERSRYPELENAADRSYAFLFSSVNDFTASRPNAREASSNDMLAVWCINHGLAMLLSNNHRPPKLDSHISSRVLTDHICKFVFSALSFPTVSPKGDAK